jgi:hypothetical protein
MKLSSLDDLGAFLVQKLVAAVGAKKFDLLVPEFLPVTVKLALALRTGHPKNLRHGSVPRIFSRQGAKFREQIDPGEYFDLTFAFLRVASLFF